MPTARSGIAAAESSDKLDENTAAAIAAVSQSSTGTLSINLLDCGIKDGPQRTAAGAIERKD